MRTALKSLLVLGLFFAPATGFAQGAGEVVEIRAQVIDLSCYTVHNMKGDDHRMCTQVCGDQGVPLAFLAQDGTIYHPVSEPMPSSGLDINKKLREHAERTVTVRGKVVERSGTKGIVIESVRG